MKTYILLVALLMIIFCHWSAASHTGLERRKSSVFLNIIRRRLSDLWSWIRRKGDGNDSFVGRCFGIARKLKFAMPLIIFKLGVIVTILIFLTVFSLKTLGLVALLLLINSSGWVAKLASFKHGKEAGHHPQNVHLHVHPEDGHHSDYGHSWYDRSDVADTEYESLDDRLKRLEYYDNYYRKL